MPCFEAYTTGGKHGVYYNVYCSRMDEWEIMREVWSLPAEKEILNIGHDWLFDTLVKIPEDERMRVLMITWRNWATGNE